jgi:hypothetical protein
MLKNMKTLNFKKIRDEFVMLTLFHGEKFKEKIDTMKVDDEIKNSFKRLINEFMSELFEISEFDPQNQEWIDKVKSQLDDQYYYMNK